MISPLNCKPPITAKQTKDQHQTVLIQRCQQVYALDLDNALSHNVKESEKKFLDQSDIRNITKSLFWAKTPPPSHFHSNRIVVLCNPIDKPTNRPTNKH